MPRESYRTDDEDDDFRRAGASGGGIPGWVWVVLGGGALAVLVVGWLGFATFNPRDAAVRQEVARVDMMRAEVKARPPVMAVPEFAPDGMAGAGGPVPVLSLVRITNAYKGDPAAADNRYTGRRLHVRFEVKTVGAGWAGASADLGAGLPPDTAPNVIFRFADDLPAPGETVLIEGQCEGLTPGRVPAAALNFSNCRVVRE